MNPDDEENLSPESIDPPDDNPPDDNPPDDNPPDDGQDAYGNPPGTVYTADGEPILPEPETAPEPAPQAQAASPISAIANSPYFSDEEKRSLLTRLEVDPLGVIQEYTERVADRRNAYQAASNDLYLAEAEQAPSVFKAYGPAIRQHLNFSIKAELRGTQDGVRIAALSAIFDEAKKTGSLEGALKKALATSGSSAPATRRPATNLSPEQRMPSPSVSSAAPRRRDDMTPGMRGLAKWGLSNREIRDIAEE